MKVSAITEEPVEESFKRSNFIRMSNKYMSVPEASNPVEQTQQENKRPAKLGIENLQEFTIFPKQVIDGRTVITA
jgi:hypothetical protein